MKIINVIKEVWHFLLRRRQYALLKPYLKSVPQIIKEVRHKDKIKVLFVVNTISKWKTEALFAAMQKHPRFEPIVGLAINPSDYPSEVINKLKSVKAYLEQKNYHYVEISLFYPFASDNGIDIVFFNEAHFANYTLFNSHQKVLYCYVGYCFETTNTKSFLNSLYQNVCWQYFVENQMLVDYAKQMMDNKARNMVVTGLPIVEELMTDKSLMPNPWKKQSQNKKRIIWAPHHTIGVNTDTIHFGSFLSIADDMVRFAEQYKEKVQFAFKPHPALLAKLTEVWGKEKADAYYTRWAIMENTQLEEGRYVELFKYSDAIIQDSASFIIEYLYMQKHCIHIDNGQDHEFNEFTQLCYNQYHHGSSAADIETFIQNVIGEVDYQKEERNKFFNNYLLPPNGQSASQNIINAILGE